MATRKHTNTHTYTRVKQCSHASVGLAQARPNKLLTLGAHAQRVCVCVCVCVSVTQHLIFHVLFVPQTILTFSAADEDRKF